MRRLALGPLHTPREVVLGVRAVVALGQGGLVALVSAWMCTRFDAGIAAVLSGVAAAACGLLCALLAYPAAWIARAPSHDSLDRIAVVTGAALGAALATRVSLDATPTPVDPLASSIATAAIAVGAVRMIARRRWLARVIVGREPGLAVLGPGALECDGSTLPLGVGSRDGCIARESAIHDGPFRGAVTRALVAPLQATRVEGPRGHAERVVLALAVAPVSGALGAVALVAVDEMEWASEYGPIAASAYHGVALSAALLGVLAVLVGARAPTTRWPGRIVVLALPAGLLEGGIAVSLASHGTNIGEVAFVLDVMCASLVSIPSALVIGPVLAWMSSRAARVAAEPESSARTARSLAPFVLASGIAAVAAGAWRATAAVHGAIAIITGVLLLTAADRFQALAVRVASPTGSTRSRPHDR